MIVVISTGTLIVLIVGSFLGGLFLGGLGGYVLGSTGTSKQFRNVEKRS